MNAPAPAMGMDLFCLAAPSANFVTPATACSYLEGGESQGSGGVSHVREKEQNHSNGLQLL